MHCIKYHADSFHFNHYIVIKEWKFLQSCLLIQVVQIFLGSGIHYDGSTVLRNSSHPLDMELYSDLKSDQDSEVGISIKNNLEVLCTIKIHFNHTLYITLHTCPWLYLEKKKMCMENEFDNYSLGLSLQLRSKSTF